MSAPQLRVIKESKGVSTHWDPNTPWAREPRLRSVVELGSRRRQRQQVTLLSFAVTFFAGLLLGWVMRG